MVGRDPRWELVLIKGIFIFYHAAIGKHRMIEFAQNPR